MNATNEGTQKIETVSLNGWIGKRFASLWEGNLKNLDWDGIFLLPFKQKTAKDGYIGLGKTLSALIRIAKSNAGDALLVKNRIINELINTQEECGYIGIFAKNYRTFKLWDVHEQAYILQALLEEARLFDNNKALLAATKLADWLLFRLSDGKYKQIAKDYVWNPLAIIGLDRAFYEMSIITTEKKYLDFCAHDLGIKSWFEMIIEGRQGHVRGHAYAYLARCLCQLYLNQEKELCDLPQSTKAVIAYLRAGGGLVISGTCGHSECWHSDQQMDGDLGETCTTAYLIRWAAYLLKKTHDSWFGDLMERAIYNALFAAASEDGKKIRYYSAAQGNRKWHTSQTYCCPGNYRRIVSELPDYIARINSDRIVIDLFESSTINFSADETMVTMKIDTDYPFNGQILFEFALNKEATFDVYLRYPGWCKAFKVFINNEHITADVIDNYIHINRTWRDCDVLKIIFEMQPVLIRGFRRQENKVAIMYGPVIYTADAAANKNIHPGLSGFEPDISTFRFSGNNNHANIYGKIEGRSVKLELVPFSEADSVVTYFNGCPQSGEIDDHLLWIAHDPIGTGKAPRS